MTVEVALLSASYCFFSITVASFWPHLDMRPLVLSVMADFHLLASPSLKGEGTEVQGGRWSVQGQAVVSDGGSWPHSPDSSLRVLHRDGISEGTNLYPEPAALPSRSWDA